MNIKKIFLIISLFNLQFFTLASAQQQELSKIKENFSKTIAAYNENSDNINIGEFDDMSTNCWHKNNDFKEYFIARTKSFFYYFKFYLSLKDEYLYGNSPTQNYAIDELLEKIDIPNGKAMIDELLALIKDDDKIYLQTFLSKLINTYQDFNDNFTAENSKVLVKLLDLLSDEEVSYYNIINGNTFYKLGFKKSADLCDTTDVYAYYDKNSNPTYMTLNSIDSYNYGFWMRRSLAGTSAKAKELIEYALQQLKSIGGKG